MTARIREFLRKRADDGPCLVVDLDVVRENYLAFAKALPDTKVFYAVKANPNLAVLRHLAGMGLGADVASGGELRHVLRARFDPTHVVMTGPGKRDEELAAAVDAMPSGTAIMANAIRVAAMPRMGFLLVAGSCPAIYIATLCIVPYLIPSGTSPTWKA